MGSGGTDVHFNGGKPQGWRHEPIDGEWLESVGFQRRETPKGARYWHKGLLTFYTQVEFCCCPLPHIKTRQQMLDAMEILLENSEGSND